MALIDEIAKLRHACLLSLDESHNYYAHTKAAWRLVQEMVRQGRTFTVRNQDTGKTVDEKEFSGLAQVYVTGYLASATFQHFVSLFEQFVFDFLRAWLREFPRSLSGNQLQFRTVLDAADKSEIVASVVEKKVVSLLTKAIDGCRQFRSWSPHRPGKLVSCTCHSPLALATRHSHLPLEIREK